MSSLSEIFNIKADAAIAGLEQQSQEAFYDRLAKHGFVAQTQEQADQFLAIHEMLEKASADSNPQPAMIKQAFDHLASRVGHTKSASADTYQQEWDAQYARAAQDALDPTLSAYALIAAEQSVN